MRVNLAAVNGFSNRFAGAGLLHARADIRGMPLESPARQLDPSPEAGVRLFVAAKTKETLCAE